MGLLSHLTHPKGKIWIALDKGTFQEGEPVVGKIHVEAEEYIPSIGLKVEARVVESWNEMSGSLSPTTRGSKRTSVGPTISTNAMYKSPGLPISEKAQPENFRSVWVFRPAERQGADLPSRTY